MEHQNTHHQEPKTKGAATSALAIVGFIALILLGMALAIYAASFMPKALSRIGQAAVSLTSSFNGKDDAELQVVTQEQPVTTGVVTLPQAAPANPTPATTPASPATTYTYQQPTTYTYQPGTPTYTVITVPGGSPTFYGDPDLKVEITAIGYLRNSDTDSFVRANRVPDGKRGAVQFRVTNIGTDESGKWKFEAELPTSPSYTYKSSNQRSLNPGDRIDFTLGFDQPRDGKNREVTITVDSGHDVRESNERNNEDSDRIDIDND